MGKIRLSRGNLFEERWCLGKSSLSHRSLIIVTNLTFPIAFVLLLLFSNNLPSLVQEKVSAGE